MEAAALTLCTFLHHFYKQMELIYTYVHVHLTPQVLHEYLTLHYVCNILDFQCTQTSLTCAILALY